MTLDIDATVNFQAIDNAFKDGKSGILLEGGSRSGKTVAIVQWLLLKLMNPDGLVITFGRDHLTKLKKTAWIDIEQWLQILLPGAIKNLTEIKVKNLNNLFRGIGTNDDLMLTHGLTQNMFWLNEAMSIAKDTFDQMEQRTSDFWIVDYNPSATQHWLYDVANRPDVAFFKSTVLDNPFAPERVVKKILSYEPTEKNIEVGTADAFKWKVYGLGERSANDDLIFQNTQRFSAWPDAYDWKLYGLDFGFADSPAVLVEIRKDGNNLYCTELIRVHGKTNDELAELCHESGANDVHIVADSAEPKSIKELKRLNLLTVPANKGQDSVRHGIDKMKQYRIFVHSESSELADEFANYKYAKKKNGEYQLDNKGHKTPMKDKDHGIDAIRYALTKFSRWA